MKSAADLVQEHLRYMTTDLTKWRALFNENLALECSSFPTIFPSSAICVRAYS